MCSYLVYYTLTFKNLAYSSFYIYQVLLKSGANVNAATGGGSTPLHRAAYQGHKGVVETLLSAGANPSIQDCQGRTAAHKAIEGQGTNGKEVLDIILEKHPGCANVSDNKGKFPTDR